MYEPIIKKLRCQPIARHVGRKRFRLRRRTSKLMQLSVSITRLGRHRKGMLYFGNKRPNKWDYLIAQGKI